MPCYSEHMEPTALEKEHSRVLCLIREVHGGGPVDVMSGDWAGYHKKVYPNKSTKEELDRDTRELCELLSPLTPRGISDAFSLELQIWWRDHQKFDRKRKDKEKTEGKYGPLILTMAKAAYDYNVEPGMNVPWDDLSHEEKEHSGRIAQMRAVVDALRAAGYIIIDKDAR